MRIRQINPGRICLLSGIPRSGTTLACNVLNQCVNTVALHEPLDPNSFKNVSDIEALSTHVWDSILNLRSDIIQHQTVVSGASQGLNVDNPVSEEFSGELRRLQVRRGKIKVNSSFDEGFLLVVKQNAFFAALAPYFAGKIPFIALIRNPVDVLMSWWTVDLPVNQGRIPAAERIGEALRNRLRGRDCLQRQLEIYKWFSDQFITHADTVLKYEDIIGQDGLPLFKAFDCKPGDTVSLNKKTRAYPEFATKRLMQNLKTIVSLANYSLYSKDEIERAAECVLSTSG